MRARGKLNLQYPRLRGPAALMVVLWIGVASAHAHHHVPVSYTHLPALSAHSTKPLSAAERMPFKLSVTSLNPTRTELS